MPLGNRYVQHEGTPKGKGFNVTPSDSQNLPHPTHHVYVGTTGNITCILAEDTNSVTFYNLSVGWHPIMAKQILLTGTTAAQIVGLYS